MKKILVCSLVAVGVLIGCGSGSSSGPNPIPPTLPDIDPEPDVVLLDYQSGQTPPQRPAVQVIDNVNVLTLTDADEDEVKVGYRVVIKDNKIDQVGAIADVAIPEGATVIDGNNGYLVPGFIDSHAHLEQDGNLEPAVHLFTDPAQMSIYLQQGITSIRTYSGTPRNIQWRDKVDSGEWLGARIISSGPIFNDREGIEQEHDVDFDDFTQDLLDQIFTVVPDTPEAAKAEVKKQKDLGYDYLKVYSGVRQDIYEAVIDEPLLLLPISLKTGVR